MHTNGLALKDHSKTIEAVTRTHNRCCNTKLQVFFIGTPILAVRTAVYKENLFQTTPKRRDTRLCFCVNNESVNAVVVVAVLLRGAPRALEGGPSERKHLLGDRS